MTRMEWMIADEPLLGGCVRADVDDRGMWLGQEYRLPFDLLFPSSVVWCGRMPELLIPVTYDQVLCPTGPTLLSLYNVNHPLGDS